LQTLHADTASHALAGFARGGTVHRASESVRHSGFPPLAYSFHEDTSHVSGTSVGAERARLTAIGELGIRNPAATSGGLQRREEAGTRDI